MKSIRSWVFAASAAVLVPLAAPVQAAQQTPTPLTPSHTLVREAFPTYTWTKSSGATLYRLYVENASGLVYQSNWISAADAGGCNAVLAERCRYTPTTPPTVGLKSGPHTWWVIAWSAAQGTSSWSAPKTFSHDAFYTYYSPEADSGAPASTRTTGGERDQNSDLSLYWSVRLGPDYPVLASWYRLYMTDSTGVIYDQWHTAAEVCGTYWCNVLPVLPAGYPTTGEITWWLQAYSDDATYGNGGYGNWSHPDWFRYRPTTGPRTNFPVMVSPASPFLANNAVSQEFRWQLPPGAPLVDEYWLTAGTSRGGNDLFDGSVGVGILQLVTDIPPAAYVYVRLWHRRISKWAFNDWRFFNFAPVQP